MQLAFNESMDRIVEVTNDLADNWIRALSKQDIQNMINGLTTFQDAADRIYDVLSTRHPDYFFQVIFWNKDEHFSLTFCEGYPDRSDQDQRVVANYPRCPGGGEVAFVKNFFDLELAGEERPGVAIRFRHRSLGVKTRTVPMDTYDNLDQLRAELLGRINETPIFQEAGAMILPGEGQGELFDVYWRMKTHPPVNGVEVFPFKRVGIRVFLTPNDDGINYYTVFYP